MPKYHNLPKLLYRVPEAAEVLSIGRTRIYELMNHGQLRSVKVGSSRLIPVEAIEELAAQLAGDAA